MHKVHVLCLAILPLKFLHVMRAGLLEKGAAFFSDLYHYPWMDFPLFLTLAYCHLLFGRDFSSEQSFLDLFIAGIPALFSKAAGAGCDR